MTPEELDKIEALVKAATPGQWRSTWCDTTKDDAEHGLDITIETDAPGRVGFRRGVVSVFDFNGKFAGCTEPDAEAIAALHNAAPALIAAARQIAGYEAECAEIDQVLGRALGYPLAPGSEVTVRTGEHTPASLAMEAAREVGQLRAKLTAAQMESSAYSNALRRQRDHDERIAKVKAIREETGCGLKEALDIVNGEPRVAQQVAQSMAAEENRMRATVDAQTAIIVDLKVEKAGLEVDVERLRAFVPKWSKDGDSYGLYVGTARIGLIDSQGYGWARIGPHPDICYQPVTLPGPVAEAARAVCVKLGIPDVGVPNE